ncbi:DNA-binding response regulator [Bacillus thuringiensis]|uniref:Response regulator transcription factor n=2 Tax=Bacillus cereus group TaxID=86661 RepID=A0AAN6B993_BACCE|nr:MULTISPECIES: response regulator transcription factor [Bacillus]MBJ9982865.1 response regulator transcription factor [Bacillus sp. S29]MBK0104256.1 response regulator transcription factor [Bacillus sp. S70]MBK0108760.1 response regulator transcription factor [Bacillus sp. S73]MBK0138364.1 response regulator transcription factor [Bacillus sp. S72]MBK0147649.1 response regulator transcription factor [Bacillus sp. S74]MBK0160955.1 response regulator transcription factor [Bacillus sp. S71]
MKIKVLLVDDHTVVLKGLAFFLSTQEDLDLVGEANNGKEALVKVGETNPDVILMDLYMPEMDGVEATAYIKKEYPNVKVIVLTSFSDQAHVLPALRAGASGYILKDVEPDQLVEAIRSAYKGNIQLHPDIANALLSQTLPVEEKEEEPSIQVDVLTARENEVLQLLAKGMSNKEIASVLVITEKTVKAHVSSILSKLNLSDRTQAALYAVKNGIV